MELKDYLHYYLGCKCKTYAGKGKLTSLDIDSGHWYVSLDTGGGTVGNINDTYRECPEESKQAFPNGYPPKSILKPLLRRLEDMTEGEMVGLLQSMVPADMEDKPKDEDYDLEMFYNDDGLMVDADIAVGANFTCICFEGQIGVKKCGSIILFDENKDVTRDQLINTHMAFHYLLRQGFDLFGLIPAGLAIDAKTMEQ